MEKDRAAGKTLDALEKGKGVVDTSTPIHVKEAILKFGGSTLPKFSQKPDKGNISKMSDDEEITHIKESPIKEKRDVAAELKKLKLTVAQLDEKVQRIQVNKKKEKYELKKKIIEEYLEGEAVRHILEEYNKKVLLLEEYHAEERKVLLWFESHGLTDDNLDGPCHCLTFKKCRKESKRRNIEELIQMFGKVSHVIQVAAIMHLWDVKITHDPHTFLYLMIVMLLLWSFL